MANRYIPHSKLSDAQIEALLWAVCSLQSVADAAKAAGVSQRSAAETMRRLRAMIADNHAIMSKFGLSTDWADEGDELWSKLHDCTLSCPSEVREPMKVFDWNATTLKGDRRLCRQCPFSEDMQKKPLLLRTLQRLKSEGRGTSLKGFKGVFVTTLIYDFYRELEVDQALADPEAMKRLGSTRHNFMTIFFDDAKHALQTCR